MLSPATLIPLYTAVAPLIYQPWIQQRSMTQTAPQLLCPYHISGASNLGNPRYSIGAYNPSAPKNDANDSSDSVSSKAPATQEA